MWVTLSSLLCGNVLVVFSPPVSPRRDSQDDMSSGASSSSISEPTRSRKTKAHSQPKGQGKITDFIKRSSRQSRDSQSTDSPEKSPPSVSSENRNTRNSGNKANDRSHGRQPTKRPASNNESAPSKRSRRWVYFSSPVLITRGHIQLIFIVVLNWS